MICLFLALVAVLLSLTISSGSINEMIRASNISDSAQVLSIAEAGIDHAVASLRQTPSFSGSGGNVNCGRGTFNSTVTTQGDGSKVIDSTGTLPNGVHRKVEVVLSASNNPLFPEGAMISNGSVNINGQGYTLTFNVSNTRHVAHVRANGNIQCTGQSSVDGGIYATGSLSLGNQVQSIESKAGVPPMQFPDAAAIATMQQNLITEAKKGGTIGAVTVTGQRTETINTPVYIDGDVNVNSQSKLIFTGTGPVYVNGSVTATGQSEIDNNATLAARDSIDSAGQGIYRITGGFNNCAMLSFSNNQTQAIKISGQAANIQMGIVYAVNGGVQINGQGSVYGAVISGGILSRSVIVGQSNIIYPADLMSDNIALPKTSKITSWVEM